MIPAVRMRLLVLDVIAEENSDFVISQPCQPWVDHFYIRRVYAVINISSYSPSLLIALDRDRLCISLTVGTLLDASHYFV